MKFRTSIAQRLDVPIYIKFSIYTTNLLKESQLGEGFVRDYDLYVA